MFFCVLRQCCFNDLVFDLAVPGVNTAYIYQTSCGIIRCSCIWLVLVLVAAPFRVRVFINGEMKNVVNNIPQKDAP